MSSDIFARTPDEVLEAHERLVGGVITEIIVRDASNKFQLTVFIKKATTYATHYPTVSDEFTPVKLLGAMVVDAKRADGRFILTLDNGQAIWMGERV